MTETTFIDAFEPVIAEQCRVVPALIDSALIGDDRSEFRRWWLSATLVVALHAAVGTAVLTWRITSKPLDPDTPPAGGPFFIDLAPLPTTLPSAEQGVLPQAPGVDHGAVSSRSANDIPEVGTAVNRDNNAEAAGRQQSEAGPRANDAIVSSPIGGTPIPNSPIANSPIVEAPMPSAPLAAGPPNDADGNAGSARSGALHALATGHVETSPVDASHAGRVDPGPIDTSITVSPSLHQREGDKSGHNRMLLLRPLSHPGNADPLRNRAGAATNATGGRDFDVRNSLSHGPGAHLSDRLNAAVERGILRRAERDKNGSTVPGVNSLGMKSPTGSSAPSNAQGSAKNAIAATPAASTGDLKSGIINGSARNALGIPVQVHPGAHGINADERREGVTGLTSAVPPGTRGLTAAAPPPGVINGRPIARPGTGLTALGGPARTVPGSLGGSDFRSKHQ